MCVCGQSTHHGRRQRERARRERLNGQGGPKSSAGLWHVSEAAAEGLRRRGARPVGRVALPAATVGRAARRDGERAGAAHRPAAEPHGARPGQGRGALRSLHPRKRSVIFNKMGGGGP